MAASGNHKGIWIEFKTHFLVQKELSVQLWRLNSCGVMSYNTNPVTRSMCYLLSLEIDPLKFSEPELEDTL